MEEEEREIIPDNGSGIISLFDMFLFMNVDCLQPQKVLRAKSVIHNHNGQKPTKRITESVRELVPVAT